VPTLIMMRLSCVCVCVCIVQPTAEILSSFVSTEQLILLLIHKIDWSKYKKKMCIYEAARKHLQLDRYCS